MRVRLSRGRLRLRQLFAPVRRLLAPEAPFGRFRRGAGAALYRLGAPFRAVVRGFERALPRRSARARVATVLLALGFPIFVAVTVEAIHYASFARAQELFAGNPAALAVEAFVIGSLFALLVFLFKRLAPAALVTGGAFFLMAAVSYFKMERTGVPLLPWDFLMISRLDSIAGMGGSYVLTPAIWTGFGILLLFVLLFALLRARLPLRALVRLPAALAIAAVPILCYSATAIHTTLFYDWMGLSLQDTLFQERNYAANGFFGGFSVNIDNLRLSAPQEYDEVTMNKLLTYYPATPAEEDFANPDVIVILGEAFWDPTLLPNVEFSADPLEHFRARGQQGQIGSIAVPSFGGGTVRTESEVLLSVSMRELPEGVLPYQQYVKGPTESLASLFHEQGYETLALHTFQKSFYDRDKAYPLLGFDAFYDLEDFDEPVTRKGPYCSDDYFADRLIDLLELPREDDQPRFVFGITMQDHGPYEKLYTEHAIDVTSERLSPENLDLVQNYTENIHDMDLMLEKICAAIEKSGRPTVLVFFGDHLPTLGGYYAAFADSGFVSSGDASLWSNEELKRAYTTPVLVWSNTGKITLDITDVSAFLLMPQVLESIGAPRSSLHNFLLDYREQLRSATARFVESADGELYSAAQGASLYEDLLKTHQLYIYDLLLSQEEQADP
ncbi:LTA synthase family protein [Feifania hominis]|uniref:Sulfatase-like hydrolase/transferase n=1 Tax=Feifania hominis TaxID=2763660 RepID=A0A926DCA9_9FIRM|nr:LTA synthase family protein [Feifania hominis]MBC8535943.1 sulfatase-like hydrolase/transferase [Feifania hominis]